ncbi:MAG TPA: M20 aminoacylase family protein [Casimicrobiaceae bacterium]|nr:M20 aminoacylase family protein [Casimicrobiaceae bacterium]
MNLIPEIVARQADLRAWRRHLHAHPETAFEEARTSAFVAEKLADFGIDVHLGLGRTGVVGVLHGTADASPGAAQAIGLRADLDALHIQERSGVEHASRHEGRMHACGHDGHTTMLLGAASALAQRRDRFAGTVHFIFQPAEENEGGGRVMVEEGLFRRFPMHAVYGMHNWPRLSLGKMAMREGPLMGAYDIFEIVATGKGAHAAMPYEGKDPMPYAAHVINALQTIVSRNLHPLDAGVVSVTQVHGGDTWNVIPQEVVLRGTVRAFKREVQDLIEQRMRTIVQGAAAMFEMSATVRYERRYPATVNAREATQCAIRAARRVVGDENVDTEPTPNMGSEDFAFMLQEKPGCYVWLGTGRGPDTPGLHNPHYDFNDDALPIGASYWVALAEQELSPRAS